MLLAELPALILDTDSTSAVGLTVAVVVAFAGGMGAQWLRSRGELMQLRERNRQEAARDRRIERVEAFRSYREALDALTNQIARGRPDWYPADPQSEPPLPDLLRDFDRRSQDVQVCGGDQVVLAAAAVMAEIQALLLAAGIEPGVVARNENTVFREYPAHATRIATARGKLLDAMRSETEPIP